MAREFYDEMYDGSGNCRSHYREFARWLAATPAEQLARRRQEADLLFHRAGITFTLYGDEQGTERLIPFVASYVGKVDVAAGVISVEWEADW